MRGWATPGMEGASVPAPQRTRVRGGLRRAHPHSSPPPSCFSSLLPSTVLLREQPPQGCKRAPLCTDRRTKWDTSTQSTQGTSAVKAVTRRHQLHGWAWQTQSSGSRARRKRTSPCGPIAWSSRTTNPNSRAARPTFRVLPGSSAPGAEGLPRAAALSEAPALGHLAWAVLQALVGAGRPPDGLGLRGPLALGSHAAGAGEDTVFQTDLLTAPARTDRRTDTQKDSKRGHSAKNTRSRWLLVGGRGALAVGWSTGRGGRVARASGDRSAPPQALRGPLSTQPGRGVVSGL